MSSEPSPAEGHRLLGVLTDTGLARRIGVSINAARYARLRAGLKPGCTQRQITALRAVELSGTLPPPGTLPGLVRRGLVEVIGGYRRTVSITEAGRALLDALDREGA